MARLAGCEEVGKVNVFVMLVLLLLLLVVLVFVTAVVTVVEAIDCFISATGFVVSGPSGSSASRQGRRRISVNAAAAAIAKDRTVLRSCRCRYCCRGRHTFCRTLDSARAARPPVVSVRTDATIGVVSQVLPDAVAVVAWSLCNVGTGLRQGERTRERACGS